MEEKQTKLTVYDKIHDTLVKYPVFRYPGRVVMFLYRYGLIEGFRKIGRGIKKYKKRLKNSLNYKKKLQKQRETVFSKHIKFSVLVPLYNTPKRFLKEMIESVLAQTYENFELCLADGSGEEFSYVGEICEKYALKDSRVKYKKLEKNLGISENTNACIDMSSGDFLVLFDHDDLLHPSALFKVMVEICEKDADFIYTDETTFKKHPKDAYFPHYKPDFSPDLLRSINYICHLTVFSRELLNQTGGFRKECDGSQDYDMILRLTEKAKKIVHIPEILYFWRAHASSVAGDISSKPYVMEAAKRALSDHLQRIGLEGEVVDSKVITTYKINYKLKENPTVSIIIPNKDHSTDLSKCLNSIKEKTTYKNYEIIIVENNSTEEETFNYYKEIEKEENIRVVYWKDGFNYAAICNFGASFAKGEQLLMLNNDIEIITPNWLEELLMYAQRRDVGAVGAKMYFPDDTIQHAGVILGMGGLAGHAHHYLPREASGYVNRAVITQNLSAVTAALMMIPKKVFSEVGGFDEGYKVAFNDVDLCMKIRQKGYLIVFTPYCEAYHYESKSRGSEDSPEKIKRFNSEVKRFYDKWGENLVDPYYNPNLDLDTEQVIPL